MRLCIDLRMTELKYIIIIIVVLLYWYSIIIYCISIVYYHSSRVTSLVLSKWQYVSTSNLVNVVENTVIIIK